MEKNSARRASMTRRRHHPGHRRARRPQPRSAVQNAAEATATTPSSSASTTRRNSASPSRCSATSRNSTASPVKRIQEFRDFSKEVKPGDVVGATLFAPGDYHRCHRRHQGPRLRRRGGAPSLSRAVIPRTAPRAGIAAPAPSASVCSPARSCAACKMPGHMGQVQPHHAESRSHPGPRSGQCAADPRARFPARTAITSSFANPRNVPRAGSRMLSAPEAKKAEAKKK